MPRGYIPEAGDIVWRVRRATRKGAASADELADVRAKIFALIG